MKDMFAQGGSGSAGIKTNKQAIARACNVKVSEVIYSNDTLTTLDSKKVVYDKPNQYIWGLPSGIPSGATIVSVTGSALIYNPGNVSVTLISAPGSQDAINALMEELENLDTSGIASSHRNSLNLDLDAIDRRPDGYADSISAVLVNGDDVEINKDITVSAAVNLTSGKHVRGVGGTITESSGLAAVFRADAFGTTAREAITVTDIDVVGSVLSSDDTNESVESYGVFSYNSLYLKVMGMRASGLTGGVYLGQSQYAIASDITAHDLVYHPNLVRGGYGVLTDGSKESIINNVAMSVGAGTNGRHVFYMSTGGNGVTDANRNIIANNLIGRYNGKNDRNFPVVVIRKSERFILNNVIGDGANAGLAFNMANGEVSDYIVSNQNYDLVKYADGVGVYGISQGDTPNPGNRWLIANSVIRVRPAAGLTSADCVAVSITHSNGRLSNLVCSIPNGSSPILIGDSATNVAIDGVLDNVLPYDALATAALISFTGSSASNIKVTGIKTSRPMFARLAVVTDLTVDFERKARITTSGTGTSTKIDSNEIIGTITLSATAVTIAFPTHVTQAAVENVRVAGTAGAYQTFITSIGSKSITVALYTPAGVLINPQTAAASFNVILSS